MQQISFFRHHFLYSVVLFLLSLVSCETELPGEGEWSKEPPVPSVSYQLSVNKTTIIVGADSSSETISITSNDDWTVSASEMWLKISDASGNGNKTITATVEANTGKETRTAAITITGKNSESKKTITVSQEGKDYTLSVDKYVVSVGSTSSTETLTITSNDSWTVSSDAGWAVLSETAGSGDKTITVSISLNSTTSERIGKITIKGSNSSIEKTISIIQSGKSFFDTNGHEYVDLGLPSGLLWATCNVGASKPEDYGDYFAWGATKPQTVYDWSHTPYQTQNTTDYTNTKFTKYLGSTTSSFQDNSAKDSDALKSVLDLEDDAAFINWGGGWRMPTPSELQELRDSNNCTWTWTTQNDVNGYEVKSKKNDNSLFLPAAGCRYGSVLSGVGTYGDYWSSSLYGSSSPSEVDCFFFILGSVGLSYGYRYRGRTVRPICEPLE